MDILGMCDISNLILVGLAAWSIGIPDATRQDVLVKFQHDTTQNL